MGNQVGIKFTMAEGVSFDFQGSTPEEVVKSLQGFLELAGIPLFTPKSPDQLPTATKVSIVEVEQSLMQALVKATKEGYRDGENFIPSLSAVDTYSSALQRILSAQK